MQFFNYGIHLDNTADFFHDTELTFEDIENDEELFVLALYILR